MDKFHVVAEQGVAHVRVWSHSGSLHPLRFSEEQLYNALCLMREKSWEQLQVNM